MHFQKPLLLAPKGQWAVLAMSVGTDARDGAMPKAVKEAILRVHMTGLTLTNLPILSGFLARQYTVKAKADAVVS